MNLLLRVAVYLPVLFLIAVVVTGQHHVTAKETLRDAARRSVRWALYTAAIIAAMIAIEFIFLG